MKILALDTSNSNINIAIQNEDIFIDKIINCKNYLDTLLLDEIYKILKEVNLNISDLDYFVLGKGPGSFTSLRVAYSTIKGIACALNIKIKSVASLDALSFGVKGESVSLIDARMNRWYACFYENGIKKSDYLDISLDEIKQKAPSSCKFIYHNDVKNIALNLIKLSYNIDFDKISDGPLYVRSFV